MKDASPLPPAVQAGHRTFPLYAQIMLWFGLNVLLVAVGAFWLLRSHFGLDESWLLTRESRVRWQFLVENLRRELEETEPQEWEALLVRLSEEEGMTFALVDRAGRPVVGNLAPWPPEVAARLMPGSGRGEHRNPPPSSGVERLEERWLPLPALGPREGPEGPEAPVEPAEAARRVVRHRLLLGPPREWRVEAFRVSHPPHYWAVARLPVEGGPGLRSTRPLPPLVLVGWADRLGATDLLFNPRPWWLAGVGMMAASALLWWPLVRGVTRALARMRDATVRIAQGDFAVRVEATRRDELGELGRAINVMTEQLEGYVRGQKRFLGDIAHELCSPLARLEMGLGVLEQRASEALQPRVQEAREEVQEMSALVDELLSFSKSSLAQQLEFEAVPVAQLVRSALVREAPEVTPGAVQVATAEDLRVHAVPSLLLRAIGNVIRNAVRHAGPLTPACPLEITARRSEDGAGKAKVVILFADHGPGVPAAELSHVFEPFYRLDLARARETGGAGLGLAIVKSCVQACGGTVTARTRENGRGLCVEMTLPAA